MTADSSALPTGKSLTDDPLGPRLIEANDERIFRFEPLGPKRPKGEVLLIHGLAGHPGRRFTTARLIAERGLAVTLFDLAGHGGLQSPWHDSEDIYRNYALSDDAFQIQKAFGRSTADTRFLNRQYDVLKKIRIGRHQEQIDFMLHRALPTLAPAADVPIFLIGFSMGGLLAADAALRLFREPSEEASRLRGAILLSPALRPRGRPSKRMEDVLVDTVWSGRKRPFSPLRLIVKGALQLNRRLDISWSATHMSDQESEVELYRRDPLVFKTMPSAYASSVESLMTVVDRQATLFPVDCLFLFPERDGITSVDGVLQFARRVETTRGSRSCRLVEFEGIDAHDLTRSSVRDAVHAGILDWLETRVGS